MDVFHEIYTSWMQLRTDNLWEALPAKAAVTTNPMLSKGWNNLACTMVRGRFSPQLADNLHAALSWVLDTQGRF